MRYRPIILTILSIVPAAALYVALKPSQVRYTEVSSEEYRSKKADLFTILSEYTPEGVPAHAPMTFVPWVVKKSGHCIYELQVNAVGAVESILSLECSDAAFLKPTTTKLLQWRFHPLRKDGAEQTTPFKYGPKKITFKLFDKDYVIMPE